MTYRVSEYVRLLHGIIYDQNYNMQGTFAYRVNGIMVEAEHVDLYGGLTTTVQRMDLQFLRACQLLSFVPMK
jgi:hypothetical protein